MTLFARDVYDKKKDRRLARAKKSRYAQHKFDYIFAKGENELEAF